MTDELVAALVTPVTVFVAVVFAALAVVSATRASRSGRAGWWAAAMFGSLAVYLGTALLAEPVGGGWALWLARAGLAVLVLFPYLLLRFAGSFRPVPRWLTAVAGLTAAALVAGAAMVPADGTPAWLGVYLIVVLAYWTGLSLVAATSLWRAGRGQPTVARRRMRLMGSAAAVLAAALLLSGADASGSRAVTLVVMLLVVASGAIFALGLRPPRVLVLSWRRAEDDELTSAMMAVLRATSGHEVAAALLPRVSRIVGGSGAALVDAGGRVVGTSGDAPPLGAVLAPEAGAPADGQRWEVVPLGDGRGHLVVWTSPYTPFFGQEEVTLLRAVGAFASLALERSDLLAQERAQRAALLDAREEAEAARDAADRANTAKSEFLSRMSHEFRTPLNAILGFGQLLEPVTPDDQEAVAYILKAGRHLLALVDDVLDLSRVEAGEMTISPEPVHAGELVDDALALMRPMAKARSISLLRVQDGDHFIQADRQRSRQILLNLVSNAVKYNRDGGEVRVDCEAVEPGRLRISVGDTGPGIDPGRQQRLFEPFERLDAEGSGVEGTGLGLALTKQLAVLMGGDVGVRSVPGQGSTFWIELPLTAPPEHLGRVGEQPGSATSTSRARTLLLVEDNLANLRLVEAMLRSRPHISVLPAMQGQVALDLARQHRPDVIVLDLHLPDLPGRDVLHRLRADPATRDIPVVVASADASPSRGRQLREEGASGYLTKPLDRQGFIDAIDAALGPPDDPPPDPGPVTPRLPV